MLNNKAIIKLNKNNKFYLLYKLLPTRLRHNFRLELSIILGLSPNYLYEKIKRNSFSPHERAVISYHLGIEQEKLFPDLEKIVEVSQNYKSQIPPLYTYFFEENRFDFQPDYISQILS